MIKRVEFGFNESSKESRLNPSWDKLDLDNGVGEFLGIVNIGNKNLMITLNTSATDFNNRYNNGNIKVNEIEFDSYQDGSIVVYYNIDKCQECFLLEDKLNTETVKRMIKSGESIYSILDVNDIRMNLAMDKKITNEFTLTTDYIYPNDYDYSKAAQYGAEYKKNYEIIETKIENLIVTGISGSLFNSLKESKNNSMSVYQMSKYIEKLQLELNNKKNTADSSYGR